MGLQEDTKELSACLRAFTDATGKFLPKCPLLSDATADLAKAKMQKDFDKHKKEWSKKYKEAASLLGNVESAGKDVIAQYSNCYVATTKEKETATYLLKNYGELKGEIFTLNQRIEKYNKGLINPLVDKLNTHPKPNEDALCGVLSALNSKVISLALEVEDFQGGLEKSVPAVTDRLKDESAQLEKLKFPLKGGKKK